MSLSLVVATMTACSNDPNPFLGLYHGSYATEKNNEPRLEIDLRVAQVNDSTFDAQMAVHHYFKKNLLFTDLTSDFKIAFSEEQDTMNLSFTLPADTVDVEWAIKEPRTFDLVFVINPQTNNLELVKSTDENILPDYFITLNRALNATDSANVCVERRRPKQVFRNFNIYNGPIKSIENHKYGGVYTYEKEGFRKGYNNNRDNISFSYARSEENGMIKEKEYGQNYEKARWYDKDNLIRKIEYVYGGRTEIFHYDIYGRIAKIVYKGSNNSVSTFYYTKEGFNNKISTKGSNNWETLYKSEKFDEYGNPLKITTTHAGGYKEESDMSYTYYE